MGLIKGAFNNYLMLKLCFCHQHPDLCKNVSHQYYATIQDSKPHKLMSSCPKIGVGQCLFSFIYNSFFQDTAFSPLKGKLKVSIINFPFKLSSDIIQCYQFSHLILPLIALMLTDIALYPYISGVIKLNH